MELLSGLRDAIEACISNTPTPLFFPLLGSGGGRGNCGCFGGQREMRKKAVIC